MNKVTFRCKRSGNTVSFVNEGDIIGLRKHEGYEEVIVEAIQNEPQEALVQKVRRRKQEAPSFIQE